MPHGKDFRLPLVIASGGGGIKAISIPFQLSNQPVTDGNGLAIYMKTSG